MLLAVVEAVRLLVDVAVFWAVCVDVLLTVADKVVEGEAVRLLVNVAVFWAVGVDVLVAVVEAVRLLVEVAVF